MEEEENSPGDPLPPRSPPPIAGRAFTIQGQTDQHLSLEALKPELHQQETAKPSPANDNLPVHNDCAQSTCPSLSPILHNQIHSACYTRQHIGGSSVAGDFLELESRCGLGLLSEGRRPRVGTYWVRLFFGANPRLSNFPCLPVFQQAFKGRQW